MENLKDRKPGSDLVLTSAEWEESILATNIGDQLVINGHTVTCRLVYVTGLLAWMPIADLQMVKVIAKQRAEVVLSRLIAEESAFEEKTLLDRPILFLKLNT